MNFGDFPNPKAAADLIRAFQKRFSAKQCMAPMQDCQGSVISAHTLSVEGMLRPIARNGHVYAVGTDLYSKDKNGPTSIALKGIRDTSVFNGFCQKHDRDLFAPIETVPFICSPEQCFLYAFRAAAKECYLKRKQAENLPLPETIKAIHGLPDDVELQLSEFALMHQAASLRGAEDVERIKAKLDEIYLQKDWRRLCTTVIPFTEKPRLTCNFQYAPDFDFQGNYLQNFEDTSADLSHLMITVFSSGTGGFTLLSHLDTANSAPANLIASLLGQTDITSALVWLIACQTENFALSPDWYDALDEQTKKAFMDAFRSNINPTNVTINQLKGFSLSVPSWLPQKPFSI